MGHFFAPDRWETPELVLRSFMPGDGKALAEALNGSYDHLKRFMMWALPEEDPDACEERVRRFRAHYLLHRDFVIAIFDRDETRVLGGSGFHLREGPLEEGRCEIGMWIRGDEAGKGLGRKALTAVTEWAWAEWPFHRLSWHCSVENVASQRVAEAAGYEKEGVLRQGLAVRGEGNHDLTVYAAVKPSNK